MRIFPLLLPVGQEAHRVNSLILSPVLCMKPLHKTTKPCTNNKHTIRVCGSHPIAFRGNFTDMESIRMFCAVRFFVGMARMLIPTQGVRVSFVGAQRGFFLD